MGVVGVLIISLYAAVTMGFNQVQFGREDMRATQILVKKIDQFRLFNWDQISTNGVATNFFEAFNPEDPTPTTNVTGGNGKGKGKGNGNMITTIPLVYAGTATISAFPNNGLSYSTNIMQLTLQLDWNSAGDLPRTRSLTTYIARYGLQNYIY